MRITEPISGCQMTCMPHAHERAPRFDLVRHLSKKLFWALRRRIDYCLRALTRSRAVTKPPPLPEGINAGDMVRVRSKEDITATLNAWNERNGCAMMEDMWAYCGSTQRVLKKVRKFVDERDYRMKRVKGLYILENVYCEGARALGPCDRTCFFFWCEEWLEKL